MSTHHEDTPLPNTKKRKRKAQNCDLEGQDDVFCNYEQHGASIVSEQIDIPGSSQHLNLVGKALCWKYYNKLIVNENHRLENVAKKQQCVHSKHEEYNIKNHKRGWPRNHILTKIPQWLQPILNLFSNALICNPCLIAMDRDKENQRLSNYQPPKRKIPTTNVDHFIPSIMTFCIQPKNLKN